MNANLEMKQKFISLHTIRSLILKILEALIGISTQLKLQLTNK